VKLELLKAIKNEKDQKKTIIEEKPKRAHQNINGEKFRGSKYRGVSKNKNKWQVSSFYYSLADFIICDLDDDNDQLKESLHWSHPRRDRRSQVL